MLRAWMSRKRGSYASAILDGGAANFARGLAGSGQPFGQNGTMPRVEWTRYPGEDVETLVAVMLLRERPRAARMRPSQGDGGIDVITPRESAPPIVDQIKSFASGALTAGRKRQIKKSLARVRTELSDEVGEWNLVLPMDHTREQLRWFASLDAPFKKNWRGLTFLEGLVAKYPEVVDYYIHGGRERVARHAADLLRLDSLHIDLLTGREVDIPAVTSALAAASEAINRMDPHYRYEFRIGTLQPGAPSNPAGWVFSHSAGLQSGTTVMIDIFARFDQATELRPIPINVTLQPQTSEDEAAAQAFFDYGDEVELSAEVRMPEGLPGGLPDLSGQGRIRIVQHQPSNRPDIELQVIDEGNATLATLPVRVTSSGQGLAGLRFSATDGSGAVQVDGRTSSAQRRATFNYSIQLDHLEGQPVRACLEVVRFTTALREPNRLALAFQHGGVFATSEPISGAVFADDESALLALLTDLSTLQQCCPAPLRWNSDEAADEQRDIIECAALLRGEAVEGTWTDFQAEMLPDGRPEIDAITEPSAIMCERDLGFEIFGQKFALGTERLVFDTVVPTIEETRSDGSFRVVFRPGGSDRFVRSLKRT